MHIDEIYATETFRLLAQYAKDSEAVGVVYLLKIAEPSPFEAIETLCHTLLRERDDERAEAEAREAEQRHPYKIGDITSELVFKKHQIHNISDLQLVFDKVEGALAETSIRLANETHHHNVTREEMLRVTETNKATIIGLQKILDDLKGELRQVTAASKAAGYVNHESPVTVIRGLADRVDRLKEEMKILETDYCKSADQVFSLQRHSADTYQSRVKVLHSLLFHDDPTDVKERYARFLEEALELGQALNIQPHEIPKLVERVYSRQKGNVQQELGGVAMTFGSLCYELGHELFTVAFEGLEELERPEIIEKVRAKRKTRHGRGLLPGFDPNMPQSGGLTMEDVNAYAKAGGSPFKPVPEGFAKEPQSIGEVMRSRDFSTGEPAKRPMVDVRDDATGEFRKTALFDVKPGDVVRVKVDMSAVTVEDDRISQIELIQMFGDEMPLVAGKLLFPEKSKPLTTDELRTVLHALANDQPLPVLGSVILTKPASFKWGIGHPVQKTRGSKWRGHVVGFYQGSLTPEGYAVESAFEPGNVQVYPVAALEGWED